ncbi:MAG: DUF1761 domain-containing protein [Micropruina glycogenica]
MWPATSTPTERGSAVVSRNRTPAAGPPHGQRLHRTTQLGPSWPRHAVTALGLGIAVPVTATATGAQGPLLGLVAGAFAGLTFSVTTLVQHNGFEQKSPRLTLINAGYQLMLFVVMGLVLGLV